MQSLVPPPQRALIEVIVGGGPSSTGCPTRNGLNSDVHGAAVAVTQWIAPSGRSSDTHDAVVCEAASRPPACMHGAAMAPFTGE